MKRFGVLFVLAVLSFGATGGAEAAAPSGVRAVKLKGELEVLFAEDLELGVAKKLYRLKEHRTGKTYRLKPAGRLPDTLQSGAIVVVRGRARGRVVDLAANAETAMTTVVPSVPAVSGTQKTMVLIANFQDAAVSCSASDVDSRMFSDPLNRSVDDLYREASFDNVSFEGSVFGPFTIPYATTSACDYYAWANAADAAAARAGVDVASYKRKVYLMPPNNPCGYVGIGNVGGSPSRSWIFRCDLTDAIAHELGHNLGLGHASTPSSTYGDKSDIMGISGLALRLFNAPHQKQTGWLAPTQYQPVSAGGTYTVAPLELRPAEAASPQVLVLAKPDTAESYFLSYRQPIGFDAGLASSYLGGISVHRHGSATTSQTFLMASLADGGVFTDGVNGIAIRQVSHDARAAVVQIQIEGGPVCTPSAPVAALSPPSQSGMPGEPREYLLEVSNTDSPECAAATYTLGSVVPPGWSGTVDPTALTLMPGASGTAVLTVAPPAAASGEYQVAVITTANGTANSANATGAYTVVPDTLAPTVPTGLQASVARGVIGLSWSGSSDNVKVAGYQVWRNGSLLKTVTGTSCSDKAIVSGTTYTYTVKASDPAGNLSGSSSAATAIVVKGGGKSRN